MARARPTAILLALWLSAASSGAPPENALAPAARPAQLLVLDDGALGPGWKDLGWAKHTLAAGKSARVDFSGAGGWILAHAEIKPGFAGLLIRLRAPAGFGDFLDVALDSRGGRAFPRVRASAASRVDEPGGWTSLWIPMAALDPGLEPFDRLLLRAVAPVGESPVEIDRIAFSNSPTQAQRDEGASLVPARSLTATLDCRSTHPISPLIYGIAQGDPAAAAELSATAYRWGGNTSTRHNFKLDSWNTGSDYFFRNVENAKPGAGWRDLVERAKREERQLAFTLPMIGWVAKDAKACGFPVAQLPAQRRSDPYRPDCGDGVAQDGSPLAPPNPPQQTSIAAGPGWVEEWTRELRAAAGGPGTLALYLLDNEPTLWNSTHRDVHPEPITYEELLERTLETSAAIRRADPAARIAGFSGWGYLSMFETGEDRAAGHARLPLSRIRHGGVALLPWWLARLREHDRKTLVRSVDLVDLHFYPQGANIGIGANGATDRDTSMRRIRSVRALWDPDYRDESWLDEKLMVVPRLRRFIADEYPGLGVVIGEYNFGAEKHISGALALAEALGRFGTLGLDAAFYFPWPERGSLASWAFRAFRNYDGKGASFGAESVPVVAERDPLASVFASRTAGGKLVLVILNLDPERALDLRIDGALCGSPAPGAVWRLADEEGLQPGAVPKSPSPLRLRPWSLAVVELRPAAAK